MAGNLVTVFVLDVIGRNLGTDIHAFRTTGMELAALGRVGRGRNGALQHNALAANGRVRDRNGAEQCLGVGM